MTEPSPALQLVGNDWKSIAKGAAIALGGCAVTVVGETLGNIDFGSWTAPVVAVASIGINILRKWLPYRAHS